MAVLNCFAAERHNLADNLFGWRKAIARQAKGRFHNERIGMAPFRWLGGFARTQFEIAGVEQCLFAGEKEALRRTKDVAGG